MAGVSERSATRDIDENVRLAQKLARDLRNTKNARRAFEISQELGKVSRELKEATRIASELARYERDTRLSARSGL
jgi:DNA-binding transcriptional regulator GbsR (MarR family)